MSNGNGRRAVPADTDAEAAFLGTILIWPSAMNDAVNLCRTEHFHKPAHQWVYQAMNETRAAGTPINADTVRLQLARDGVLDQIGGPTALMDLQAAATSPTALNRLGSAIADNYTRRVVIATAADAQAAAYDLSVPTEHALELLSPPAITGRSRYDDALVTADDLFHLPPPAWLIDGWIPRSALAVIYGPPGSAKTFLALHLALCVATGTSYFGSRVQPGRVLYVAAEGGQAALGQRIAAWCHHYHVDPSRLAGQITFLPQPVPVADPAAIAALRATIERLELALAILDTLARCMVGADENSSRDMTTAVAALEELRAAAAVIAVHHTGKNPEAGMRGHSSLLGAVDTTIEVKGDRHAINISITKQKDAAPPTEATWTKLTPTLHSVVITTTPPPDDSAETEANRDVLAEDISVAMEANRDVTWTGAELVDFLHRRKADVLAALKGLVVEGYVTVTKEPGSATHRHRLARPYRRPQHIINQEPF
jgi:hypothetical protein